MDNGSFFVVTKDFTAGVANANVDFAKNAVEQAAGKAIWIDDWTGISIHDNTYYLVGTGSVGFSTDEVVIRGGNPTRP
jgi:NADPH-dependent 2,4-dienoyl-CoA reductase/sulfur reductase-like enzyme